MNLLFKDEIGNPPWNYYFLLNLDEKEYPRYLAKLFYLNTGEKLPLKYDFKNQAWVIDKKRCKTFNQKLQWIKLYGVTPLMRQCTDKVAVRDYVKERIGEEYLKPVLQIIPDDTDCRSALRNLRKSETRVVEGKVNDSDSEMNNLPERQQIPREPSRQKLDVSEYFDQIDFDNLPNAFVMKCNHGCKWQYIIKNKEEYLNIPQLVEITKRQMTGWLEQEYFPWNGFEMQYKGIEPKILIEPLMRDKINKNCEEIHCYSFNGVPKITVKLFDEETGMSFYDETLKLTNPIFNNVKNVLVEANENIKQAFELSKELSKDFDFVRVDYMFFQNKLYFEELTFSPYSGFNSYIYQN